MFEGFTDERIDTGEAAIRVRRGGRGPPLLLLHGFPQTHAMWHRVAPLLAADFTLVLADLRGYGDSAKPPSAPDHAPYSKRAMARDMAAVMQALGFRRFALAGHDRGGRVAYRLALDRPERVTRLATLDIVPTIEVWDAMDRRAAMAVYHWPFLAQPQPLPEVLIGGAPDFYLDWTLRRWSGRADAFAPEALAEYRRCFRDPAALHAMCEDYRAGATLDAEADAADRAAGRRIACPLLALWGDKGLAPDMADPLATWRRWAEDATGRALPCGHFLAEEAPEETAAALRAFFLSG